MIPPLNCLLAEQIMELGRKVAAEEKQWFTNRHITRHLNVHCATLAADKTVEANHWNLLTNGLVMEKCGRVRSFPLTRIFSFGAKFAPRIKLVNCDLVEKLDGEMVAVCFPSRDVRHPVYNTVRGVSDSVKDCRSDPAMDEIGEDVRKLGFTYNDLDTTLVFEWLHPKVSRIKYDNDKYGLHLIAGRCLSKEHDPIYSEYTEDELDKIAARLKVRRPERWYNIDSWRTIHQIMCKFGDNYEGFILRDSLTGERVKIQKKEFQQRVTEEKIPYRRVIPAFVEGPKARQQMEMERPESIPKFICIEEALEVKAKKVMDAICHWRHVVYAYDRSTVARMIHASKDDPKWMHKIIMRWIYDDNNPVEEFVRKEILDILTAGKLKEALELED